MSSSRLELFLKPRPEERTKNVNVLLVAFVSAAVHICLGVIFAPLFSLAFQAAGLSELAIPGGSFPYGVLFPAVYAVIGFVVGGAAAFLYNKLAGHVFGHHPNAHAAAEPEPAVRAAAVSRSA